MVIAALVEGSWAPFYWCCWFVGVALRRRGLGALVAIV